MDYTVVLSNQAKDDIAAVYSYIRSVLQSKINADAVLRRLQSAMADLSFMAGSHCVYPEEPWHTRGVHFFSVGSYTIFYAVDEQKNVATVLHIIYGRRDIHNALSE